MPEAKCATCGIRPEAQPGARLCRPCLEVAETILRTLRSGEAGSALPGHITPESLYAWAVGAVADVKFLSPMAHILRGVVQGVLLAGELVPDAPERGALIALELAAMQAMSEVRW